MLILTMRDGSLPWSLHEWYMENFWKAYVGYSDLLSTSYTYEFYTGEQVEGEHSFTFAW